MKLKDDVEEGFASLCLRISDYQEQMDYSMLEWQSNFGLSALISIFKL